MEHAVHVGELEKFFDVPEREAGLLAATKSLVRRKTREVRAVDAISFDIASRRDRRLPGAERRGQDDDPEDALGSPLSDGRGRPGPRPRAVEAGAGTSSAGSRSSWGIATSCSGIFPALDSFELNRAIYRDPARGLPAAAGRAHRAPRRRRPRPEAGSAALARRADEGRDRRRARSIGRRCSSSTSRRSAST